MGACTSQSQSDDFERVVVLPSHQDKFIGLENLGNKSWSTTVIHALYFCRPFRDKVLEYYSQLHKHKHRRKKGFKVTLLSSLADLFQEMATHKLTIGSIAPKKFIAAVRADSPFDTDQQQDAQFLNFLLNRLNEIILETQEKSDNVKTKTTWVYDIFKGICTTETKCLTCEEVESCEADFIHMQLDVEDGSDLTGCLDGFSFIERLCGDSKFRCTNCVSYQEGEKRRLIKQLPLVLSIKLRRSKWVEEYDRCVKLSHGVVFPFELRLLNVSSDAVNPDRLYELVAVTLHCGNHTGGHFKTLVKGQHGSQCQWHMFDDHSVEEIEMSEIERFYGLPATDAGADVIGDSYTNTAYLLFYQAKDY